MASNRPQSSVNIASSVQTTVRSTNPSPAPSAAPPSPPSPAPSAAPATSAPPANVSQPASAPAPPNQRVTTPEAAKSTPTEIASPRNNSQSDSSRSNPSPAIIAKPSGTPSKDNATPGVPPPSGSHAAALGAVFAVLGIIIALGVSFWLFRRRREKYRRLWEAQRMPTSNFGKWEGDNFPEKPVGIEATLAADLARLRSLDQQNYNGGFPKQSLDFSPMPVNPAGFKIARKPSLRVKDPAVLLARTAALNADVADLSAPAYDVKEYISDYSLKETYISNPVNSSPPRNHDFH